MFLTDKEIMDIHQSTNKIFYIGEPTNQDADNEVAPSDVITHVTNRSELNVVLKQPCRKRAQPVDSVLPVLEVNSNWLPHCTERSEQILPKLVSADRHTMELPLHRLNGNTDNPKSPRNGLIRHVANLAYTHIESETSQLTDIKTVTNSAKLLTAAAMQAKLMEENGKRTHSTNGSKVSQFITYFNESKGSNSKTQDTLSQSSKTVESSSAKPVCDRNENIFAHSSSYKRNSESDSKLSQESELTLSSLDTFKSDLEVSSCDTSGAIVVTSDLNADYLEILRPTMDKCSNTKANSALDQIADYGSTVNHACGLLTKDRKFSINSADSYNNGGNTHNTIECYQPKTMKDSSLRTSHLSRSPITSSNHSKMPTYDEWPVKHISRLTKAQEVSLSMTGKAQRPNLTTVNPEAVCALNVADKEKYEKFKYGKKIKGSVSAEKYFDESRPRLKVSIIPGRSLGKVVEEHHDPAEDEVRILSNKNDNRGNAIHANLHTIRDVVDQAQFDQATEYSTYSEDSTKSEDSTQSKDGTLSEDGTQSEDSTLSEDGTQSEKSTQSEDSTQSEKSTQSEDRRQSITSSVDDSTPHASEDEEGAAVNAADSSTTGGLVVFDAFFESQELLKDKNVPSDNHGIEIIVEDVDGQHDDDSDSDSDSSQVDFELRARLLAQINPLLLSPGYDLKDVNDNSDSHGTRSNSVTGSTVVRASPRNDLESVKGLTKRLKLNTKRPSFVAWKEQIMDKPYLWRHRVAHQVVNKGINNDWSSERLNRITKALAWLRSELMDMRVQDQVIARQLVALRKEIQQVKLEKLTAEHQDLIEDACEMESERRDELAELDDAPPDMFSPTLKHFGLTPMNISTRRFSVF